MGTQAGDVPAQGNCFSFITPRKCDPTLITGSQGKFGRKTLTVRVYCFFCISSCGIDLVIYFAHFYFLCLYFSYFFVAVFVYSA